MKYEVIFYEKKNGERPVQTFLLTLDNKMQAKMISLFGIKIAKLRRKDYLERKAADGNAKGI